jgi:predicted RecB family endonuclease
MKEKYFVEALVEKLKENPYIHVAREHRVHRNLDKRNDTRIDVLAYLNGKAFAFEVKSDEGDVWNGIEQTAYNKKIIGIDNSYLVTGKRPTWEQVFEMLNEGIGCLYMPAPNVKPVPIVRIGDTEADVLSRLYNQWKEEQRMIKKYGG